MNYYELCKNGDLTKIYEYIDTCWDSLDSVSKTIGLLIACKEEHKACILVLLENGVYPDLNASGSIDLAKINTEEMLITLEPYWKLITHSSAFMIICQSKLEKLIPHLLKYGADVNHTPNGKTPLMMACQSCSFNVSLLLKHGANIHQVDNKGKTALEYIIEGSRSTTFKCRTLKLLLESGAKYSAYSYKRYPSLQTVVKEIRNDTMYKHRSLLSYVNKDIVDHIVMKYLCDMERQGIKNYKDK